jgi:hypothetical protein
VFLQFETAVVPFLEDLGSVADFLLVRSAVEKMSGKRKLASDL